MKVLFAVHDEKVSSSIVKKYQKEYKEIISYKNVYYFNAIIKELQRDKTYDRIIIDEELEEFTSSSYEQKDKFIFEKLDSITDEATNSEGNDIPIILICSERRMKSEEFLIKIFGIAIYNAIIGNDRSTDQVCRLIKKPRSKKEAKVYYRIDSEDAAYQPERMDDVSEEEMQHILSYFKRIGKNEQKCVDGFKNIVSQYNEKQLKIIIAILPLSVKAILEEKSIEYQKIVATNNKGRINSTLKTHQTSGTSEKLLTDKKVNSGRPIVVPSKMDKTLIKKISVKKPSVPVQPIEEPEEFDEFDDFEELEEIKKVEPVKPIEPIEDVLEDIGEVAQAPKKRGRGRPRKNPVPEEVVEESVEEVAQAPKKRGRGRPRKSAVPEEVIPKVEEKKKKTTPVPQYEEDDDLSDMDFPDFDDEDEIDNGVLPGFEDEEDEFGDVELPGFEDEEDEIGSGTLPGFEDEEDEFDDVELPEFEDEEDEFDDVELPEFEDEEDEINNGTLPGFEDEDGFDDVEKIPEFKEDEEIDNGALLGFEDEEDEINNGTLPGFEEDDDSISNLSFSEFDDDDDEAIVPVKENRKVKNNKKEIQSNINSGYNQRKTLARNEHQDYDYSEYNSLLSSTKKAIAFVGTSKNGTSFIVNNIAKVLADSGIDTAILDTTQSKNAYYIYTENEEELRKTASQSVRSLINGRPKGIEVGNNLTVYTEPPTQETEIDNVGPILENLIKRHSAVLIDCDFYTPMEYFENAQEIYLVQSMDVLTIQPLTAFLRELKAKNIIDERKIKIVINKSVKIKGVTSKTIVGGMSYYNDPEMSFMTELFDRNSIVPIEIPFDVEVYQRYLEEIIECEVSTSKYPKEFQNILKNLACVVYPLLPAKKSKEKTKKGYQYSTNYENNGFSNSVNNTLNNMKKKY